MRCKCGRLWYFSHGPVKHNYKKGTEVEFLDWGPHGWRPGVIVGRERYGFNDRGHRVVGYYHVEMIPGTFPFSVKQEWVRLRRAH